jgi:hypothetical protein
VRARHRRPGDEQHRKNACPQETHVGEPEHARRLKKSCKDTHCSHKR